jgi:hypothetical protein
MKKINFNNDWLFRHLDKNEEWTSISLPHDAMINEPRVLNSEGGTNTGWFVGEDYEYKKAIILDSKSLTYKLENLRPLVGPKELEKFIRENDNNPQIYTPS